MQTSVLLHNNGPALWPEHKPLSEVLDLQATTPESIWETTYQGNPSPPAGSVFKRSWWLRDTRYDVTEPGSQIQTVARYISWDTALKDKDTSDYSAAVIGELWPDYRLAIRYVLRERLPFPDLPTEIEALAKQYDYDDKLRAIIIEDKASGTSAYQTLLAGSDNHISSLLIPFMPTADKVTRANQAGVWCRNGCVQLPLANEAAPWLFDFEDEIFNFPSAAHDDQVDAFSQLVIYLEHLLADGWRARNGIA